MLHFLSSDAGMLDNKVASMIKANFLTPVAINEREYHRGFFYRSTDAVWKVDEKRRQELITQFSELLSGEHLVELFNITQAVEVAPGEIYTPSMETLAESNRIHALRQTALEAIEREGQSSSGDEGNGSGKNDPRNTDFGLGKGL